jgi:hemerythrin-like domain-containing protein
MKATEILKTDHRTLIALIHELKTVGKRDAILMERIYDNFKVHSQCEEQLFYPAMKEIGYTEVQQSIEEHREMDALLEELVAIRIQKAIDIFLGELNTFEQKIQEHVEEEEELLFSAADDQLGDKLDGLGEQMAQLKIGLRTSRYGMAA